MTANRPLPRPELSRMPVRIFASVSSRVGRGLFPVRFVALLRYAAAYFFVPKPGKQVTKHAGKFTLRLGQPAFEAVCTWRAGRFGRYRIALIRHHMKLLIAAEEYGVF